MDRIAEIFASCRREKRAALIIFASVGYPTLAGSEEAVEQAIANGADIIEMGVPFSDPMADGRVICEASHTALQNGVTLNDVLAMCGRIRKRHPQTGLVIFSYMNILFNHGLNRLAQDMRIAGADGVLPVDLPLEEQPELAELCRAAEIKLIALASVATPEERLRRIGESGGGFLYFVSVRGTTGVRSEPAPDLPEKLRAARRLSPLPVAVGFGISDGATCRRLAQSADAIVVGSIFVQCSANPAQAGALVRELRENLHVTQS